ncbi:MAG: phenylalanine--tRNA ligase subunit beta [Chloroflexi bacterium]|nr:phenylalanine--tRNA ligase subunit beta [Chloroflexota bacterium]
MKVPLSWLRDYVDVDRSPGELAHMMTMAGTECEGYQVIGADWTNVVIARIEELTRHPNSDHLWIARVNRGETTSTIVTGAQNLTAGDVVPLVMPGGKLPPNKRASEGLEVTARKLRGVMSEGMVCSGDELGISADDAGIYILEPGAPLGVPLADYLNEVVFDFYITPNRPDCMSVIGLAREIAALTGRRVRPLRWSLPVGGRPAMELCDIRVQDDDLAPRYSALVVEGLQVRPSPQWLQRRLFFCGVRPISNVVDITNYVMLETGQPMHAFDRELVRGGIVVRRAKTGEQMTTLDGQERTFGPDVLLIADHERAVGVAGVMGGLDSEVRPETSTIVLESANFDRKASRRASQELKLKTEASRRFERGLDPGLTIPSACRAVELLVELADGRPAAGAIDLYPRPEQPPTIDLTVADVARLLGRTFSLDEISAVLERLDFGVERSGETLRVTVPGHRRDVERKADLIEEVARIEGYDSIPEVIFEGRIPEPTVEPRRAGELLARRALVNAGLQQIITYSLAEPFQDRKLDVAAAWPPAPGEQPTMPRVFNPMSSDQSALRTSLLGSMIEAVRKNLRLRERVALFELAHVYLPPFAPLPDEQSRLAVSLAGTRAPRSWQSAPERYSFFDLKGVVDALLQALGIHGARYQPTEHPSLHPGQAARLELERDGETTSLGVLGQLHPRIAERYDVPTGALFVAELEMGPLLAFASDRLVSTSLPELPDLKMDLALVVAEEIAYEQVAAALMEAGAPLLAEARLFDVYRGAPIPEGQRSLAFALSFRADHTLTDEEVGTTVDRIEAELGGRLGARVRRG